MRDRPEYKVYRSRRRLLPRAPLRGPAERLRGLGRGGRDGDRRPWTPRRVLLWAGAAVGGWVALSLLLFLISAQFSPGLTADTDEALTSSGSLMTGSTILVLGSDARPRGSHECPPEGCGPARSDSIMLLRVGLGTVRRLSILRDSAAEIPGHGVAKINAAYALGGSALMVRTVEGFLGNDLKVNHAIEVDFESFPALIDALGGIDIELKKCVRSTGVRGGVIGLRKGKHRLGGYRALKFARVRVNECDPGEDDRARARRQQQVLSAMRARLLSPGTFLRLPLVSWQAPRAVRSDLRGLGLSALFLDLLTGGAGETRVLQPACLSCGPGSSAVVSEQERRRAVRRLLGRR